MKVEDLIVGENYKITKPENACEVFWFEEGMNHLNGHVFELTERMLCYISAKPSLVVYEGCNLSIDWLSLAENNGAKVSTIDLAPPCLDNYIEEDGERDITIPKKVKTPKDNDTWTADHYNSNYKLTEKDIEEGFIKLDPYFIAKQWKLGSKDDSGCLFHSFKLFARWGDKNSVDREIKALYAQTVRMAELYGVKL